ncbi:hypothetical protein GW17_00059910, partial [Ensete ventricosum]
VAGSCPLTGAPRAAAPSGLAAGGRPLRAVAGGCPLQATAGEGPRRSWPPLAGGLVVVGRPFAGGPWLQSTAPLQMVRPCPTAPPPRCLRCENAARTRRTILCDSISSDAV